MTFLEVFHRLFCKRDYFDIDRLEGIVIRHFRRTCSNADNHVHLRPQIDIVARFGAGRRDCQFAVVGDHDIHENIECSRYAVGLDAKWCQPLAQVFEAAGMMRVIVVNDLKSFRAAWREQEVVPSNLVLKNREHRIATVGIEDVATGEIDGIRVIDAATR